MDPLILPMVGMLIPIIIVPTVMGIRHAKFLREVEHTERMRAMELGRTLAEDESWTPASVAVLIGAGVPIVAMGLAFFASKSTNFTRSLDAMWQSAGMVGLGAVICGSFLAAQIFAKQNKPVSVEEKPAYDPEAFETVGRQG